MLSAVDVGLLRPWRQARPPGGFAAELLLKAAQTRKKAEVEMAMAQARCGLVEGWLWCPAQAQSYRVIQLASSTCSTSNATSPAVNGRDHSLGALSTAIDRARIQ